MTPFLKRENENSRGLYGSGRLFVNNLMGPANRTASGQKVLEGACISIKEQHRSVVIKKNKLYITPRFTGADFVKAAPEQKPESLLQLGL
jgi:hypothetical protein